MASPGVLNEFLPKKQSWEVDPEKETALGQMQNVLASGNPLLKQQETQALQTANRRGVLNSATAIQAGQGAVLNAALPLAADAADTYRQQSARSQGVLGQFGLGQQQIEGNKELSQMDIGARKELTGMDIASREKLTGMDIGSREKLAGMDIGSREKLAEMDIGSREKLAGMDIGSRKELAQMEIGAKEAADQRAFDYQTKINTQQADIQKSLASLDQDNKVKFAEIEMAHQKTLQQNSSANTLYQNTINAISQILSNPDLSPDQQAAGKNAQYEMLEYGLKLIGSIPPDAIDFTGNVTQSDVPVTSATGGGMAQGQAEFKPYVNPYNGSSEANPTLGPGKFLGEIVIAKEQGSTARPGQSPQPVDVRLQWTNNGWVRV